MIWDRLFGWAGITLIGVLLLIVNPVYLLLFILALAGLHIFNKLTGR